MDKKQTNTRTCIFIVRCAGLSIMAVYQENHEVVSYIRIQFSARKGIQIRRNDERGKEALAQYIIRSPFFRLNC